ncbi:MULTISPECIES: P-type DNA transfer ATPase VirB11 [Sphingomonas]|jgi:type IV secretion system protein VirB11|uniref:P-type DNA transfer ATPase VirB11 n=1 Tax=Sphingomonas TaxID=13687 RepID=UPI001AE7ACA6
MNALSPPGTYLDAYLRPLAPWLERGDVTDIYINAPGGIWVETLDGQSTRHPAPDLTESNLWRLATQIAAITHQGISREHPLVSATLPGGARVQIVAPPATRGALVMAIRRQVVRALSLADYEASDAFAATAIGDTQHESAEDIALAALLEARQIGDFLRQAVRARKNILISGGTSTGKTTFLNALLKAVPERERLVLIEDTPEVEMTHPNSIGLIAVRGGQGEAQVEAEDLLKASLRLRPDRIILGELRGSEAFSFLRAVNSGHPGSITTVHADSPAAAIDQIALMVMQAGTSLGRGEIVRYVESVIDVSVQLVRGEGGRRVGRIVLRR